MVVTEEKLNLRTHILLKNELLVDFATCQTLYTIGLESVTTLPQW